VGRRRYRRARHRRALAIIFVVFLLVCLGVLVAAVAVNALPFERPESRVPVLLSDSRETPSSRSP
jgi:ABC-type transporter Mla subunit MlaD